MSMPPVEAPARMTTPMPAPIISPASTVASKGSSVRRTSPKRLWNTAKIAG